MLEIEPAPKGVIDLFEVKSIARTDCAVDGAARDTAHLVDHHLGRHGETGAAARRQRDSKERCIDAVGRDRTDRDARVRRVEHS